MSLVRLFSLFDDHPPGPRAVAAALIPAHLLRPGGVRRAASSATTATAACAAPPRASSGRSRTTTASAWRRCSRRRCGAGWADGGVPDELKLLCADGRVLGGVSALLAVVTIVPWLARLRRVARCRPLRAALDRGYRWVAAHRRCGSAGCHPG